MILLQIIMTITFAWPIYGEVKNEYTTVVSKSQESCLPIKMIRQEYLKQVYLQNAIINQIISMNTTGSIQVIYGPMFSGKSSELLRKIRRFQHARKACLVLNFSHDNRYSTAEQMATHDKVTKKAMKVTELIPILKLVENYDVIGIDQGQFFPDIVQFCEQAANKGKTVLVAALDGTFQRKPFGNIISLIPLAEKVQKLCAVCVYCTKEAAFTKRIVESKEIQLIGGAEMYKPVCRQCFFEQQQARSIQALQITEKREVSQTHNPEKEQAIQIVA